MNVRRSFRCRALTLLVSLHVISCSQQGPSETAPDATPQLIVPSGHDGREPANLLAPNNETEAVESGRVELLTFDRKFTRRSREGNAHLEVRAAIPQFLGAGPGIERINGFLRHLVLNWPELVHLRDWENERPVEPMRQLAAKLAALGPEDWPLLTEIYDAPLLTEHLIELSEVPIQEVAIFEVTILQFAGTEVTLHFESIGVAATSHSSVGELTVDLTTGRAVRVP